MIQDRLAEAVRTEFEKKRILVLGDLMVDEYILGKVGRISPEAPVPVLNYKGTERSAGGASNVALNMHTMGGRLFMAGVVGTDDGGIWLREFLSASDIDTEGIVVEENRMTTLKTRFATKVQQLLRVDREDNRPIQALTQTKILGYIAQHILEWDAVVLSDYCKGVFDNPDFVRRIIRICNENRVIVTIDSKSRNIDAFENADFVKPNNLELENAVNIKICDLESLDRAGKTYLERSGAKSIIVTRGAEGISIFERGRERADYASKAVQVFDVTGAGDTVISTITLGIASGLSLDDAVVLANIAAGVVIGKRGTAAVSKDELLERLRERKHDK
ncbi:MAG: bifunctional hydroxymethylpyrimidine kinase/phosphomethylpyrimidine kinase [Lachnospiraceae bacterium]|nr:bifunctional hydroxymethylpyrimidine kinase/phosphomethylpyrimidine kinase [Lachnospiraceae bacterium]